MIATDITNEECLKQKEDQDKGEQGHVRLDDLHVPTFQWLLDHLTRKFHCDSQHLLRPLSGPFI